MIQVGMIYPWEEEERLGQYVNVRCPSSVTHQFIHAYGLPRWNVIFRSNWLIQFIMPEVKLAIRVFYLGLLQYLIYLELRFPEGKKKVQIFDVQSPWFYFPTYFQCFRSNPGFQALQKSTLPLSHTLSSRIWIMIIKHVSSILI